MDEMPSKDPESGSGDQCKFCVIHMYGVYVLNISSFLVLCIVLFLYRKEVIAYFTSTSVSKGNSFDQTDAPNSPPNSPPPMADNALLQDQDIQLLPPPPNMMLPNPPPPPLPPDAPPTVERRSVPQNNISAKKSHESTGSNYFKQMMRGKKPVASISQYQLLKKNQKKGKMKQGRNKNETKNKARSQKAKREAEVKRFAAEANKLTKGLPS